MSAAVLLSVWIPGRPKTKGSLSVVNGRRGVLTDTPASKRWRELMGYAVKQAMEGPGRPAVEFPVVGHVSVAGIFYLPVSDPAAGRAGDADKLARNLLDALQDVGVYADDAQVVRLWVDKHPAGERGPGVQVHVGRMP